MLITASVISTYDIGKGDSEMATSWAYDMPDTIICIWLSPGLNIVGTDPTRVFLDLPQILSNNTNAVTGACPEPLKSTNALLDIGPVQLKFTARDALMMSSFSVRFCPRMRGSDVDSAVKT